LRRLADLQTFVLDNCKEVHAAEAISQDLMPPGLSGLTLRLHTTFGSVFSGLINMPACSTSLTKLELVSHSAVQVGQMRRVLSFFPQLLDLDLLQAAWSWEMPCCTCRCCHDCGG